MALEPFSISCNTMVLSLRFTCTYGLTLRREIPIWYLLSLIIPIIKWAICSVLAMVVLQHASNGRNICYFWFSIRNPAQSVWVLSWSNFEFARLDFVARLLSSGVSDSLSDVSEQSLCGKRKHISIKIHHKICSNGDACYADCYNYFIILSFTGAHLKVHQYVNTF